MTDNQFFVYLLVSSDDATYVGATVDVNRRLRQHNKEIKGGAHATAAKVNKGETWVRACHVSGFPDWSAALQFEWRWKQLGRTQCKHIRSPLGRRLHSLHVLLSLERPTTAAIPYDMYPDGPPTIHWESDDLQNQYSRI